MKEKGDVKMYGIRKYKLYVKQESLDCHRAIECNRLTTLKVATWNVRTKCKDVKLENFKQKITRLKITILELCVTR